MKFAVILSLLSLGSIFSIAQSTSFIRLNPVKLSATNKSQLAESLHEKHARYDSTEMMLTRNISEYNYHTDALSGNFHDVRTSLQYAVQLMDLGEEKLRQRAFDVIKACIALQDTTESSRTRGIWPYFKEEPLVTKKSPPDFNWADFNGVSLLEIWTGHYDELTDSLRAVIRESLVLAAKSIQKRNVGPSYTNIAIMGTYVTYMTAHLFDVPEMKIYAANRLKNFYEYTLKKKGFTEYNSPTYTVIAINELERMQRNIVEPAARQMIDSLYFIGWEIIARHYHAPTGQWAGPHSRAYTSIIGDRNAGFYRLLHDATGGRVMKKDASSSADPKAKHQLPPALLHYFIKPVFPRTQSDLLEPDSPRIAGTTYLTNKYALSSVNRSSMWNQRRPFLVYWGSFADPKYLQVRFLHDLYDFSSASFYSQQNNNQVLAAINLNSNAGDKHISIDKLKSGGLFRAKDLRIRFELGYCTIENSITLPENTSDAIHFKTGNLQFHVQMFKAVFDELKGYWQKGSDAKNTWIDYVIYNGAEKDFDLKSIRQACWAFSFVVNKTNAVQKTNHPAYLVEDNFLKAKWEGMQLTVPVNVMGVPRNL